MGGKGGTPNLHATFRVALLIIANPWLSKPWCSYGMGYWSGMKGTRAHTSHGMADSQRQVMVCKRSQSQNERSVSMHLLIVWHSGEATVSGQRTDCWWPGSGEGMGLTAKGDTGVWTHPVSQSVQECVKIHKTYTLPPPNLNFTVSYFKN